MAPLGQASAAEITAARSRIANEIWGNLESKEDTQERLEALGKFFERYEWERQTASRLLPSLLTSHADVQEYVRLLKSSCAKPKQDIRETLETEETDFANIVPGNEWTRPEQTAKSHTRGSLPSRTGSSAAQPGTAPTSAKPDQEGLHLALRITFLTTCVTPGRWSTTGQGIFRPAWKDTETLVQVITRVYPTARPPQESRPLSMTKLTAGYLEKYASVEIKWTDKLSDHLTFLKGADFKSLYIFKHPAWLKTGLDTLERDDVDLGQTTERALQL